MTEVLTWPERVLREVPDHLLLRTTGKYAEDRKRVEQFRAWCKARRAYPSLLEIENERARRNSSNESEIAS